MCAHNTTSPSLMKGFGESALLFVIALASIVNLLLRTIAAVFEIIARGIYILAAVFEIIARGIYILAAVFEIIARGICILSEGGAKVFNVVKSLMW